MFRRIFAKILPSGKLSKSALLTVHIALEAAEARGVTLSPFPQSYALDKRFISAVFAVADNTSSFFGEESLPETLTDVFEYLFPQGSKVALRTLAQIFNTTAFEEVSLEVALKMDAAARVKPIPGREMERFTFFEQYIC